MSEFAYPLGGKQDYTSAQAGAFHGTRTSGVWSGEDNLKVTITGARQLTLSKGIAWFTTEEYWGKVYVNTADINFTLPVAMRFWIVSAAWSSAGTRRPTRQRRSC